MRSKPFKSLAILGIFLTFISASMAAIVPIGQDSPYIVELNFSGLDLDIDPKAAAENDGCITHSTRLSDPDNGIDGCYISVCNFSTPISEGGLAPALKAAMEMNCVGVKVVPQEGGYIGTGVFTRGACISRGLIVPMEAEVEGVDSFGMIVAYFNNETLNDRLVKSAKFWIKSEYLNLAARSSEIDPSEFPGTPITMTENSIEIELLRYPIVIVDFWSTGCSHCKDLVPVIDELAEEFQGEVVFGKINMNENPSMWDEYGIRAMPTVIVFKNGTVVERIVGAPPKSSLERKIEGYLSG